VIGGALIAGHAVPFLALLTRRVKRDFGVMSLIGAWLIFFHWLDVYWLLMPQASPAGAMVSWTDLACAATVGGACTGVALFRRPETQAVINAQAASVHGAA
jgi:hypothetical protein